MMTRTKETFWQAAASVENTVDVTIARLLTLARESVLAVKLLKPTFGGLDCSYRSCADRGEEALTDCRSIASRYCHRGLRFPVARLSKIGLQRGGDRDRSHTDIPENLAIDSEAARCTNGHA